MSQKTQQLHTAAIFEIDSASIGVSVIGYSLSEKFPEREYMSSRIELDTHLPFEMFFSPTIKVLTKLAHEAQQQSPAIEHIYVSLSSPWVSSQKRVSHYKQEEAFVVTDKLISQVIEKELSESLSKNLDYHTDHNQLEIFERRTVDVYVNGYPTHSPVSKKKVTTLDIYSITSVLSTTTKDAFIHALQRVFHQDPILISNTFVLYESTKRFLPHENSISIIDVGGTNTEMFVVHDDHLKQIARFPVGKNHILEYVSSELSISIEKAQHIVSLYMQKSIDPQYKKQLTELMSKAYKIWLREWYTICDRLSQEKLLPSTICLVASKEMSAWLRFHILATDELKEHLHTQRAVQVIEFPYYLRLKADEEKKLHISDSEMLPVIDLVADLLHTPYE